MNEKVASIAADFAAVSLKNAIDAFELDEGREITDEECAALLRGLGMGYGAAITVLHSYPMSVDEKEC